MDRLITEAELSYIKAMLRDRMVTLTAKQSQTPIYISSEDFSKLRNEINDIDCILSKLRMSKGKGE